MKEGKGGQYMRKSKQFVSMPVISLVEGQQVGSIKGLVINPAQKAVAALIIEQKGWFKDQRYIPFSKVRSIGDDALTIDRRSNAEKGTSLPELMNLLNEKFEIVGSKLIAENGTALGIVEEFYVDLQSGGIVGLEFSGGALSTWMKGSAFLDINHIRTLGKKVIICSNEALENIIKMDGGFQEKMRGLRESTGHLWTSTLQKTRDLGASLNKTLEKVKKERDEKSDGEQPPESSPCCSAAEKEKQGEHCSCCNNSANNESMPEKVKTPTDTPPPEESVPAVEAAYSPPPENGSGNPERYESSSQDKRDAI
jgi:uncharacterized protein YrrD